MKLFQTFSFCLLFFTSTSAIPAALLYTHNVPEAIKLPQENDVSSPEIKLKIPVVFYGNKFNSLFVNSNGFVSFQTEIPNFFNIEFPLDYPLIAPFYTNVDTRATGTISYYETSEPALLRRATENVQEYFSDQETFQAKSLFIVTWFRVGYFNKGSDKTNSYQLVIINDGAKSFVELLYPKEGIQWIQGTGDESGLPDARAQAGFISAEGKMYTLPGSGTEQIRNLEVWSNIDLPGQFMYRIDSNDIQGPDLITDDVKSDSPENCAEATTYCHVQATCIDYEEGFCCECKKQYYGNGRFCVKKDVPLRVNGKVNGKINGERLENLDLQSYIVMVDGRAYTAISKIPESIGFDIQSLQILGGVIGYVFAKPIRNAQNGYQFTGGVFNHTATMKFLNTSQTVTIKQKYLGLDVFDQLRLEANIQGEIPELPFDSKIEIDEYQEQYTLTSPGVLQMSSTRTFKYQNKTVFYDIEQVFTFDYCKHENFSLGESWKLKVGKNFISYESKEQIIRFGLTNKVMPLGEVDPCQEGRSQCTPFSACVVDGDNFRCVCNPGFQQIFTGNETVCADIDECQTGLHSCDYNAGCVNQIGSYSCTCNPGFTGNGQVCENEFSCNNVMCPGNSECFEGNNVAMCRCMAGFTGDGQVCTPMVDKSCHTANNCDPFAVCTIDPSTNSYYCACLPGYEGDGYTCNKIEVAQNVTEVTVEKEIQRCVLGVCWCPEGYTFEKGTTYCIPKEDVTTTMLPQTTITAPENVTCNVLNNCDRNAQCVYNTENETFSCKCNEGYNGDGYKCENSQSNVSCAQVYNCGPNANCYYDEAVGKSSCVCNPGYVGDGFTCTITAICTSNADCTQTEECLYTSSQRYECVCKEDYVRDSQNQCVKPSTCGGGICVDNAECLYDDAYQLYYCSCKTGYMGDGITECKPRPIGCNIENKCGLHAICEYNPSTTLHECQCERGYYGDGYVCYTEINCHVDPTLCDTQATCVTDASRRYICQCNTGFVGNGTICRKNPTHDGNFLLLNQGVATLKIPFEASKKNLGRPIQIRQFQTAVGLDIDCYEGRVFWSDISGRAIRSSGYNGSNKSDFITQGIGSPEGLAVDWVSRNIYWTDSTKDTVEVASIDTKRRRVLFDKDLVNPRGIAVHPQRGKIFWADWDRKSPKIEWSNADGTGRSIFLQGASVSLPNSLSIDYDTEQLCYSDAGTKKIECVDIDSKVKRTIATNCTYPFGIAISDKHIYWSDWITKKIERVEKNTLTRLAPLQVPLGGSGNNLYGLVAVPHSCPQLTNVCQYYKDQCPVDHICLPNGAGSRTCVCTFKADNPDDTPSCKT